MAATRFCRKSLTRLCASGAAFTLLASQVWAQPVRLELRPRAGDTLVLRVEQQAELIGSMLRGNRDTSITIKTSLQLFARAVVETSGDSGATIVAVTDSLRLSGSPQAPADLDAMRRSIEGKIVRMRVNPDGSSELLQADSRINAALRTLLAEMPATLPRNAVEVGNTWTRSVSIPLEHGAGKQTVRTTFRLDSLSQNRLLAYISMRGVIVSEEPAPAAAAGSESTGDLRGNMTLDRRRGWIVDSVATININTVIRKPAESLVPALKVQIRMTQRMHTQGGR